MRYRGLVLGVCVAVLTGCGTAVCVFAQAPATPLAAPRPELQAGAQPPAGTVRRLSADDAVRQALENNLGVQVSRLAPLVEDLSVAQARAAWRPSVTSALQQNSNNSPNNSFLSGAGLQTVTDRFATNIGVDQALPWGGSYSFGWDTARQTTNNPFSNFSPQLNTSASASISQPLIRNFGIDSLRQQLRISEKNREIADVQVRQSIASTTRTVRNAYWDLAFAIASLQVQQQSLDLANESLRNTRARVEIGTTPPIDTVEAEAEVATREEAVIVAQAQIGTAEDTLRALVFDPRDPEFWTLHIEPTDTPAAIVTAVDVDGAVRNALDRRTDLQQSRKSLEANDINLLFLRNQTLPDVTANFDYGLTGLGGTQFERGPGFPGEVTGSSTRGFGSVLSDLFGNQYPSWTASLNIRYPVGGNPQQASLARARLQYQQSQVQLRNQQLQVATQVREAARQLQTNSKRLDTTRSSRLLAERRLDAEQRKFTAGTSTNFLVFQAQRDLAQARNNELRAVLDYQRSVVDLETVQQVPLTGGGGTTGTVAATSSTAAAPATR